MSAGRDLLDHFYAAVRLVAYSFQQLDKFRIGSGHALFRLTYKESCNLVLTNELDNLILESALGGIKADV